MRNIIFEEIVKMTQEELHSFLCGFLKKFYADSEIFEGDKYLVAHGDIDVGLVAHLDTVHFKKIETLVYDSKQKIYWSPEGLGADDRAGVWAIMEILLAGYRPSVFFFHDEEKGTVGASWFALEIEYLDEYRWTRDLKYLVEIDRAGNMDSVFYSCGNNEFKDYINQFGFVESYGSFTDIVELSPILDIASVNLSSGYYNAHRTSEYLKVRELETTIKKIKAMLDGAEHVEQFEYMEEKYYGKFSSLGAYSTYGEDVFNKMHGLSKSKMQKLHGKGFKSTASNDSGKVF